MSFLASDSIFGDLVNTTVDGRFVVECVIGSGATGIVYRARHALMHKSIALKVIQDDVSSNPKAMERFKREIQAITMLDHESIVKPLACGLLVDGRAYLAMDLVDGLSIAQSLQVRRFSPAEVVAVAIKVSLALSYAHECGIVHRDVSPRNIVLTGSADTIAVKILDFGISALSDNSQPSQGTTGVKGSPHYMSPEQCLQGAADARSDIYSLGCVMYEMLTGQTPYAADSAFDLMYKHAHEPFPGFPSAARVDRKLATIVACCMEKQPGRRFADMASLAQALQKCLKKLSAANRSPITGVKPVRRAERLVIGRSAVLFSALCVAGVGVLMLFASEPFTAKLSLLQMRLIAPAGQGVWLESQVTRALAAGQLELAALLNEQAQALPAKGFYEKERLLLRQADIIAIQGDTDAAQARYLLLWRQLAEQLGEHAVVKVKPEDGERHLDLMSALFARLQKDKLSGYSTVLYLQAVAQYMIERNRSIQALPLLTTARSITTRLTGKHSDTNALDRMLGTVYLTRMKIDPARAKTYALLAARHFRQSIYELNKHEQPRDGAYALSLALLGGTVHYLGNYALANKLRDEAVRILDREPVELRFAHEWSIGSQLGAVPEPAGFWLGRYAVSRKRRAP